MITIIISAYIIILVFLAYILARNRAVCAFRQRVNELSYDYCMRHLGERKDGYAIGYNKLPSYDSMLYSFKRLRLESYFDKETIKELLS